jgi:protein-L-isoaspartate(D-aspartate) O-methyltransferase
VKPAAQTGLADKLGLKGRWRDICLAVPRAAFIPDRFYVEQDGGWTIVDRHIAQTEWQERVDDDAYIVTQLGDGLSADAAAHATSSASQPGLVFRMLQLADLHDSMRVLEIGTGTGYNAGLLAARLGEQNVTTIEVDADVAENARAALSRAGLHPTVVTGDGADGFPPGAPYDRIIATAAVQRVPYAWVKQCARGGVILTPFGTAYHNSVLLRLVGDGEGTASGRIVGECGFMWLRAQRTPHGRLRDFLHHQDDADHSRTDVDPRDLFDNSDADFAIGVLAPGCLPIVCYAEDDSGELTLWLVDGAESWASVDYVPHADDYAAEQYGPRRLFDEVTSAYRWWKEAGRPRRERFGLTVDRRGQRLWLDSPDNHVDPITAGAALSNSQS